jgi:hypothetical protein
MSKTHRSKNRVGKNSGATGVIRVNQSMLDIFNTVVEANPSADLSAELIRFAKEYPVKRARLLRKPDAKGRQCSLASD